MCIVCKYSDIVNFEYQYDFDSAMNLSHFNRELGNQVTADWLCSLPDL